MAERASVFQVTQIGLETTPGTAVAANKRLASMAFSTSPKAEISKFRPQGYKFQTVTALGKEWAEASVSGLLTFTEVVYALSSVLKKVTPTGAGAAKTWTFSPSTTAPDVVATYSMEQGDSISRAHKVANMLFTGFNFSITRSEANIGGAVLSKAIVDNATLTASPTEIELVPVLPGSVDVYLADTAAGLDSATALLRPLAVSWDISDRFGPLWALNSSLASFAASIEKAPSFSTTLKMEADAEGMGLLSTMRSGATKFMRIKATGPEIEEGVPYLFQCDTAVKVDQEPSSFTDEDGIYAIEWNLGAVHDPTWGKSTEIKVVNKLASL